MDDKLIERAAKIMKITRLSKNSMMDKVAIKLNCNPTHDEIEVAKCWLEAFELAKTDVTTMEVIEEFMRA